MILDVDKKFVRAAFESGHKATSSIKNLEINGDHLILQGVEEGRSWNMAVASGDYNDEIEKKLLLLKVNVICNFINK